MPNIIGKLTLEEYAKDLRDMGSCLVIGFDKLTVAQASELRRRLKEEGLYLKIVKNRLARLAFSNAGLELPKLSGKCGLVFAPEEKAITAARTLRDFGKKAKPASLSVIAGVIEDEVIHGEDAKTIADMPDKDGLRSMLASVLQAPGQGIAVALRELGSSLARCLKQRSEGKGKGEGDAPVAGADADSNE